MRKQMIVNEENYFEPECTREENKKYMITKDFSSPKGK